MGFKFQHVDFLKFDTLLNEDERLVRFTKICFRFPRTVPEIIGSHASFKVRKKTFACFLNYHHGDGIVGVLCKVLPGDNAALIKTDPKRFLCDGLLLAGLGWMLAE